VDWYQPDRICIDFIDSYRCLPFFLPLAHLLSCVVLTVFYIVASSSRFHFHFHFTSHWKARTEDSGVFHRQVWCPSMHIHEVPPADDCRRQTLFLRALLYWICPELRLAPPGDRTVSVFFFLKTENFQLPKLCNFIVLWRMNNVQKHIFTDKMAVRPKAHF
jgi:hypothetical protein